MGVSVDLTGRRVLVTGASSGIGAATCRTIVGCGGSVAMLARRKDRLDEIEEVLGDRAVGIRADVTDFDGLETAVAEAARALGGLDGVISAAGRSMAGSVATGTPQRWRELIDLNLLGPLATVRHAIAHFAVSGRRDIVIVGSAGAVTAMPGTAIYSASKRGLRAAADTLRLELAGAGINVSLVMPGLFETEGLTMDGIIIDGEVPPNEFPLFAGGAGPGTVPGPPAPLAHTIAFVMSLPDGVCINELVVRPTGELNP
jgi:NADP-dependent 3-hydroxy acid dehydrogenase YdfG